MNRIETGSTLIPDYSLENDRAQKGLAPFVDVGSKLSDVGVAFCDANALKGHFLTATNLAKKCFSSLSRLDTDVEHDPDSDDAWITLTATVSGTVEDVLSAYNNYSSEWVRVVSSPQRFMIRLSLSII